MVKEYLGGPHHDFSPRHHQPILPYAAVARYIDFLMKYRGKHFKDRRDPAKLSQRFPKPHRPKNTKRFDIVG